MAEGALERSPADLAVAITGVAGPEPDEDGNPVGRVCIAVARRATKPLSSITTMVTSEEMQYVSGQSTTLFANLAERPPDAA
jgi:nicotinamide-nucleotide amidase